MRLTQRHPVCAWRRYPRFFLFPVLAAIQACAAAPILADRTVELRASSAYRWLVPATDDEVLSRWRGAVGVPLAATATAPDRTRADEITVVSWNTAVGDGDLGRFIATVHDPATPLVLLLQEVFRRGSAVPARLGDGAQYARRLGTPQPSRSQRDIESVARATGLLLYYVPSMRNGGPASNEDRGNAILSSVPLDELTAIELPFERQRRVALAGTVSGVTSTGRPWRVRLVSAHLDNMAGASRAWVGGEYARARQAAALRDAVGGSTPTVLGADLNTWFGAQDAGYRELAGTFDELSENDTRATRGLLRLDHLLLRLGAGWSASVRRGNDRFGSDHYPLVGSLRFE